MRVIGFITLQLVIILFFSTSISNYNAFKEIVLALIAYSMMNLFLISNYDVHHSVKETKVRKFLSQNLFLITAAILISVTVSQIILFVVKNVPEVSKSIQEVRLSRESQILNQAMESQINSSAEISNILVRERNREKKLTVEQIDKMRSSKLEISEKKKARLKDELSDNFLFKRYSDVILIIASVSACLLLLTGDKPKHHPS